MPKDTKEPQSYGSGPDWVTGKTGQKVTDEKPVRKVTSKDKGAERDSDFKKRDSE